jgi:acyl-CoA synthetase (AMP-forming)/AMP-acid ligase II
MQVPLGIGDFLDRAALVYGDREAVADEPGVPGGWGRTTYTELRRRAWGMAHALTSMGVGEGERVAIVSPNAARFLCSYWGVSAYRRVLVPVNYRLNAEEVKYIIGHSGASVVLIDPEFDEAMAGVDA